MVEKNNLKEKEYVTIKSENKEVIQKLKEEFSDESYNFLKKGSYIISIVNLEGHTHERLEMLTRKMRDVVLKARYKLEGENCSRIYEYNYMNGKHCLANVGIQYNISYLPEDIEILDKVRAGLKEELYEEVKKLYERIDEVNKTELGDFKIDDNKDKEIIVKFKKEGLEITLSKIGSEIFLRKVEKLP